TMIENVVGQYNLPFGIGLNFRINERDMLLPMVIEEPSVVAAASNAARMIREGGGFFADVTAPIMIGQVQLLDIADPELACEKIREHKAEILGLAAKHTSSLVRRGGGPVGLQSRILSKPTDPDGGMVVVHLHIDVCDAMGANLVNTAAEGVAKRLAEITGGSAGLRILSNLAAERTATVRASIPSSILARSGAKDGESVRDAIVSASRFAELDPYRATTHNKGIMNGVDAVLLATANDWRSAEAGAHAYAAKDGTYRPLAVWTAVDDTLRGEMTLPMAVGTVGGALQVHDGAKLALKIFGSDAASDLAAASAAVGLACNLAALRALATEGIQKGHMALHSRIVDRANKNNEDSP
ncbi:MAG: hydroxymethylglutaryl-CoA reductase, degradative, partial [Myxococcales bacterium]|nr:hydroxymethylglutaryl-CoA reductase, degradative [Myxococcales bacterium]